MPLELSDFPEEVQVAFFVFSLLTDRWEGMSGSYLGKYWEGIDYIFKIYGIPDPATTYFYMKMWENILVAHRLQEAERKRKAEERKAKSSAGGGKTYTHNVQG